LENEVEKLCEISSEYEMYKNKVRRSSSPPSFPPSLLSLSPFRLRVIELILCLYINVLIEYSSFFHPFLPPSLR